MADLKGSHSHEEAQLAHTKEHDALDGEVMVWDAAAEKRLMRKIDWRVRILLV